MSKVSKKCPRNLFKLKISLLIKCVKERFKIIKDFFKNITGTV